MSRWEIVSVLLAVLAFAATALTEGVPQTVLVVVGGAATVAFLVLILLRPRTPRR